MAKGSATQGLFDAALINAVKGLAIGNDPNASMPSDVTSAPAMRNLNPIQQQILTGIGDTTLEERQLQSQAAAARVSRTKFAEEQALLAPLNPAARAARTGDSSYARRPPTKTTPTPAPAPAPDGTPDPSGTYSPVPPEIFPTPDGGAAIDEAFGAAEQSIGEIYQKLATKDYSTMIKDLVAQGRVSAGNLNTAQIKEITDAVQRRDTQLTKIKTDTTADLTTLNADRIAQQGALITSLTDRMTAYKARNQAAITAGNDRIAQLGPEITGEFTETANMVSALVDSMSESSVGTMERLAAVANMAAAQRVAAPGLMYIDATTALGDEQMRMVNEANMLKAQTISSLNVQEKELLLNEAMRIEQFNNSRDAAEAQALVNLGMAKLQSTIEEVHRAEDKQERDETLRITTLLQQQASKEDTRQWEAEFALKKDAAASAGAADAQQAQFLAANSGWTASDVSNMSDSMRKELFDEITAAQEASRTDMAAHQNAYFDLVNSGWTEGQASTAIGYHLQQRTFEEYKRRDGDMSLSGELRDAAYVTYKDAERVMKMMETPYMRKDSSGNTYLSSDWTSIQQAVERLRLTGYYGPDPDPEVGYDTGSRNRSYYAGSGGIPVPGLNLGFTGNQQWDAINSLGN